MKLTIKKIDDSEIIIENAFGWCSKDTFRYNTLTIDENGLCVTDEFHEIDWNEIKTVFFGDSL